MDGRKRRSSQNSRPQRQNRDSKPKKKDASLARQLAQLDAKILELCNERAELAVMLSETQPVTSSDSQQLLTKVQAKNRGPLPAGAVQVLFRELQSASLALVQPQRVAYLGPEFSYSHLAAVERFGQGGELIPVANISAVFQAVDRGDVQFGLVPIENSTDGRIVDTLEMFARLPVRICGEVQVRIHHNLLGRCVLSKIGQVHSKPQALSQCRGWLAQNLPNAELIAATSTTAAAEKAATSDGVAAIASRQAAVHYGLQVVVPNIEDNPNNVTRFAVIGKEHGAKTGRDKTSLMFELAHEPGALADAMAIFKRNRLNLTWIESFPKQGSENEYLFFVELEGHQSDLLVRRAIKSLRNKTTRIDILGCYAKGSPVG